MAETREPQYEVCFDVLRDAGRASFGLMSNQVWHEDPKRLGFLLARYKFVAKMFSGRKRVLEVGCADAFGTRVVRQEVPHVTAVDFDPLGVLSRMSSKGRAARWPIDARVHDMLAGPVPGGFDGAYALDVLEHIPVALEDRFVGNMAGSLNEHGVIILGMPSLQSQAYASPPSKAGHVNCKDGPGLKETVERFFHNVFIFSMNDEVVHTGFHAMAHYLIALGCGKKQSRMNEQETVLIVGCDGGMIGRALAQRFAAVGCAVARTALLPEPGAIMLDLARDAADFVPPPAAIAYLLCGGHFPQAQCRTRPAATRAVNVGRNAAAK